MHVARFWGKKRYIENIQMYLFMYCLELRSAMDFLFLNLVWDQLSSCSVFDVLIGLFQILIEFENPCFTLFRRFSERILILVAKKKLKLVWGYVSSSSAGDLI